MLAEQAEECGAATGPREGCEVASGSWVGQSEQSARGRRAPVPAPHGEEVPWARGADVSDSGPTRVECSGVRESAR